MVAPIDLNNAHRNDVQSKIIMPANQNTADDFASKMEARNFNQVVQEQTQKNSSEARIQQDNAKHHNHQLEQHKHRHHNNHNIQRQGGGVPQDVDIQAQQKQHNATNEKAQQGHENAIKHNTKRAQAKHNKSQNQLRAVAKGAKTAKMFDAETEADLDDNRASDSDSDGGGSGGDDGGAGSQGGDANKQKKKSAQRKEASLSDTIKAKASAKKKKVSVRGKKVTVKKALNRVERSQQSFENFLFEEDETHRKRSAENNKKNLERMLRDKRRKKKRRKRRSNNEMVKHLMEGLVTRATVLYDDGDENCEMHMHLTGPLIDKTKLTIKQIGKTHLLVTVYASSYSAYTYFQRHLASLKEMIKDGKHKETAVRLLFVKDVPEFDEDAEIVDLTELSDAAEKKEKEERKKRREEKAAKQASPAVKNATDTTNEKEKQPA